MIVHMSKLPRFVYLSLFYVSLTHIPFDFLQKRGPPKGCVFFCSREIRDESDRNDYRRYVESLESRLQKMETLLQRVRERFHQYIYWRCSLNNLL